MRWLPYPMIRIAGFFTAGVLLGIYSPGIIPIRIAIGFVVALTSAFFFLKIYAGRNRFPLTSGILGLSVIFLLGYVRLHLYTDSRSEEHLSKFSEPVQAYEAIVRSVPEEKAKSWKIEIEMVAAKTDNWKPVKGRLLLYVSRKNLSVTDWHYGDRILVNGNPQEVKPPANPGEFDFRHFLSFKNISHQHFVQANDALFLMPAQRKGFIYYSHQARAWSMKKLNEFIAGQDEQAIAAALVLGVTDGIDNDLLNAYAASGAMHVLAVSGMHVGIIYVIILFLFKPLNKYRWSTWVTSMISLILLWAFAFVTGLSPSVLRAVTMFSFIALARPFGRQTNIYNTLASSAFILLIYNPYLITSVGFQLSYLAVLGIVYLQRPVYNIWEIDNWMGDWIWRITSVSIAAQLATFALGLLYFHQFPTYFLISNLFVIPLSTLVLVIGIFLLGVSFISPLASFTAVILEWLIKALNWTVFTTEALPFSLINNIYISNFQGWLLMAMMIALILLFEFRSIKWLYVSSGLAVVFSFCQWNHFVHSVDQEKMIVYAINNHEAMEFIDCGHSLFAIDSSLQRDLDRIRFHIQPNRLMHGVANLTSEIPFHVKVKGVHYFRWKNRTFAWITDKAYRFPQNASIDFLIVSRNSLTKNVFENNKPGFIIFDGSNAAKLVSYYTEQAAKRNIGARSVVGEGVFTF